MEKVWGAEYWIVNEEQYCAKILVINPGFQSSLHYHNKKIETFILLSGTCLVTKAATEFFRVVHEMPINCERLTIFPSTTHRFANYGGGPSVILEISTHHSDDDVVRLSESGALWDKRERSKRKR